MATSVAFFGIAVGLHCYFKPANKLPTQSIQGFSWKESNLYLPYEQRLPVLRFTLFDFLILKSA